MGSPRAPQFAAGVLDGLGHGRDVYHLASLALADSLDLGPNLVQLPAQGVDLIGGREGVLRLVGNLLSLGIGDRVGLLLVGI